MKGSVLLVALTMASIGSCEMCATSVVEVDGRTIRGVEIDSDRYVWKGIPYATAEPFAVAQPITGATGEWAAEEFGPRCPQLFDDGNNATSGVQAADIELTSGRMSRDCLTLSVYLREGETDELPVYVWFYGGAFAKGSTREQVPGTTADFYDGHGVLGDRPGVFVTVNYRLGAHGFLSHPLLDEPGAPVDRGSYGLWDQVRALQWVQRNIREFRGDPNDVTIVGESAGGISVCQLMSAPDAVGLFDRAVVMSGSCLPFNRTVEQADTRGEDYVTTLLALHQTLEDAGSPAAGNAECTAFEASPETSTLRACLSATEAIVHLEVQASLARFQLFEVQTVDWVTPVGTEILPEFPARAIRAGVSNSVELIAGNVQSELGNAFAAPGSSSTDDIADIMEAWRISAGLTAAQFEVLAGMYGMNWPVSVDWPSFRQMVEDVQWNCPTFELLSLRHQAGVRGDVAYRFNRSLLFGTRFNVSLDASDQIRLTRGGTFVPPATHGTDVAYLFGHSNLPPLTLGGVHDTASASLRNLIVKPTATPSSSWEPALPLMTRIQNNGAGNIVNDMNRDRCPDVRALLEWDCSCTAGTSGCPAWCPFF